MHKYWQGCPAQVTLSMNLRRSAGLSWTHFKSRKRTPSCCTSTWKDHLQKVGSPTELALRDMGNLNLRSTLARINWTRSFSRAFIIIPAPQNSRALQAGLPYAIINDQLIVRSFGGNRAWGSKDIPAGFLPNLSLGGAAAPALGGGAIAPAPAPSPVAGPSGVNMALATALGGMSAAAPSVNPAAPQLPDEATMRNWQQQRGLVGAMAW